MASLITVFLAALALVHSDRISPAQAIREKKDHRHHHVQSHEASTDLGKVQYLTPDSVHVPKRDPAAMVTHADIPYEYIAQHQEHVPAKLTAVVIKEHVAPQKVLAAPATDHSHFNVVMGHTHTGHLGGTVTTNPETSLQALIAYPVVGSLVVAIIVFLYWPRGKRVICSVVAYLLFLSSMKLTVKYLFSVYAFNFPKFVCMVHFFFGYAAALIILLHRGMGQKTAALDTGVFNAVTMPDFKTFWLQIFPISLGFATAIAANNMALVFSSAAFTEIIGCTTPIFSCAVMLLTGIPVNPWLLVPIGLVISGCAVSVTGEVNFSAAGMALCCLSNVGRAVKCTLQQKLLTAENKESLDPVNMLAWMCLPSVAIMGGWSVVSEGLHPLIALGADEHRWEILKWLIISGINATALNLSQIFVTKEIGALGGQLTAQAKSVLTMLGGMVFLHETVTPVEWAGFVVVLLGVYLYTRWDKKS